MAMAAEQNRYVIHPAKFSLWIFIVTIILFFGGLTSAYIVSKGIEADKGMWYSFEIPTILWYNTGICLGHVGQQRRDLGQSR